MVNKTIISVGSLILVISAIAIIITMSSAGVKLTINEDEATFKVLENSRWVVSGKEIVTIWEGSSKLNRKVSSISLEHYYCIENLKITQG